MKSYYRLMLGGGSMHGAEYIAGSFIGVDYGIYQDLTDKLPDDWRPFNKEFAPIYMASHPGKTRIGAGRACAAVWTVSKGMKLGDIVLMARHLIAAFMLEAPPVGIRIRRDSSDGDPEKEPILLRRTGLLLHRESLGSPSPAMA
jgi:hypothetical protein